MLKFTIFKQKFSTDNKHFVIFGRPTVQTSCKPWPSVRRAFSKSWLTKRLVQQQQKKMARRRNDSGMNEKIKQLKRKMRIKKELKDFISFPPDLLHKCAVGDATTKCAFRAAVSDRVTKHQLNHFDYFIKGESNKARNFEATQEELDQWEEEVRKELRNSKQFYINIYFFLSPFSNQKTLLCCLCFNLDTSTVTSPIVRQSFKRPHRTVEPPSDANGRCKNTYVVTKKPKLQNNGKYDCLIDVVVSEIFRQ